MEKLTFTRDDITAHLAAYMADGRWHTANNLRRQFPVAAGDTFWGAITNLYKAKTIERSFDAHGVTLYRWGNQ
jgi:hypothetical protein